MKKIFVILLLSLSFISCSKDIENTDSSATLFGVVSDLKTGDPISLVQIELCEGLAWDCLGDRVGVAFTGTDGFFQINGIDPDEYYFVIFRHSDYTVKGQGVNFKPGKKTELNMTMSK